jgi:hypothetical protein
MEGRDRIVLQWCWGAESCWDAARFWVCTDSSSCGYRFSLRLRCSGSSVRHLCDQGTILRFVTNYIQVIVPWSSISRLLLLLGYTINSSISAIGNLCIFHWPAVRFARGVMQESRSSWLHRFSQSLREWLGPRLSWISFCCDVCWPWVSSLRVQFRGK